MIGQTLHTMKMYLACGLWLAWFVLAAFCLGFPACSGYSKASCMSQVSQTSSAFPLALCMLQAGKGVMYAS